MTKHESSTPYYIQIREYVRQHIISGAYPENSRLPSERELAKQFNVSRLTVTKALNELAQEGWIETQVGKGTFVAPRKIDQELLSLTSFTEDTLARGHKPASRILKAVVQESDAETAHALDLPVGAAVVLLSRVRLADQQPIALENTAVNAALCPNILDRHNFAQESLYEVLRTRYNLHLAYAHQTIEAREASDPECEALEIHAHMPILAITRVTFSGNDRPIEYVRSAYRGDRYKLRAVLRRV